MAISETILSALLVPLMRRVVESLGRNRLSADIPHIEADEGEMRSCLGENINHLENWVSKIHFRMMAQAKHLESHFVELSLHLGALDAPEMSEEPLVLPGEVVHSAPTTPQVSAQKGNHRASSIDDIYLRSQGSIAILGRPGAGKSTSLQRIGRIAVDRWREGTGGVPILVSLRDLPDDQTLIRHLLVYVGFRPFDGKGRNRLTREECLRTLCRYLNLIEAILLVDGLDEVRIGAREEVERDIRDIAARVDTCRLILTCRTADYRLSVASVTPYTILPLSNSQIHDFASRWLGEDRARPFVSAVRATPYGGSEVVPLTLAHLCVIYDRDGELPDKPMDVYEMIVSLGIEDWDRERLVTRQSHYAEFLPRKRERFLQAIAYRLTLAGLRGNFDSDDLFRAYADLASSFKLPGNEARAVVKELQAHTGLIQPAANGRHEFNHLVIQEYLAAMHASRLARPESKLVPGFPNEMALVVAASSGASGMLEEVLCFLYKSRGHDDRFAEPFLARLAVERPVFETSVQCGWALICWLSIVTPVAPTSGTQLPDKVRRILDLPGVGESLRLALLEAQISLNDLTATIIPVRNSSMPPRLYAHLKAKGAVLRMWRNVAPLVAK